MKIWRTQLRGSEFKVTRFNDALPTGSALDNPERLVNYLRPNLADSVIYRPDVENFIIVHLNTRRNAIGFEIISTGTLDTLLVHAREVFKSAIVMNAAAIALAHNLCAATHKLCYVKLRVMCSCRLVAHILAWSPRRKECYAR